MQSLQSDRKIDLQTTRILAAAALIVAGACTMQLALAQQFDANGIAPGAAFPRHTHPGTEIAYALAGTMEYQLNDQPPVTLKAGDALFIAAGTIHSAKNVGAGNASELAT
jgi:mannose-6-phosphate isomerase-like protein (cupin superfamily)